MVGPWPPTTGGVTTFMRNVTGSPLREKYEFVPFTTSRPAKPRAREDNYGYRAIFEGGLKRIVLGVAITLWHLALYPWVVLARRPALIQVQASDFQAFWEASLYVLMGRLLRRPVVLRIGGSFNRFYESSGAVARCAIRWTLRLASLLIVQSEYWKNYVAGFGHRGATVVLNNFVRDALVETRTSPAPPVRRFLLYCGEVPRLKGAYVLLDAVRELAGRGAEVEITVIGASAALRADIAAAGLARHFTTLDWLPHEAVLAQLRRSDVLLQISSSEGFPNLLLEAMALGCAAIVTPVGAVPEVVGADGECACIVPVGDAAALAGRMARLAEDPGDLLARMAAAARARVVERYTERTAAQVLDHAWQSVMRGRSPDAVRLPRVAPGSIE
jgi:glycosyltransferase involved in cell wall biosynthesis